MGISERYAQQQWESAILSERMGKAKSLHADLKSYAWDDLSDRDRIIMDVLGWITLENDNAPELDLHED